MMTSKLKCALKHSLSAFGRFREWNHAAAQRYELKSNCRTIRETFGDLFTRVEHEKQRGGLWHKSEDQWFDGDEGLWSDFSSHVRDRKCLEIGSGPYGFLAPSYWIRNRIVIDPLIDHYRRAQLA